jgi:hypothetical protein
MGMIFGMEVFTLEVGGSSTAESIESPQNNDSSGMDSSCARCSIGGIGAATTSKPPVKRLDIRHTHASKKPRCETESIKPEIMCNSAQPERRFIAHVKSTTPD